MFLGTDFPQKSGIEEQRVVMDFKKVESSPNMSLALDEDEKHILLEKFPQGLVCLDLETTGLSPLVDKVIELAAFKIGPTGEREVFHTLINPQRPITPETIKIHHITDEMVQNAPIIAQVLPSFLDFVGRLPILAHNAKFDLGFLTFAAHTHGLLFQGNDIYCSCKFARKALPSLTHYGLDYLVTFFQLSSFQHHRAFADARAALQVFARLLKKAPRLSLKKHSWQFNTRDYKSLEKIELPQIVRRFIDQVFTQTPLLIRYRGGSLCMDYRPIRPSSLLPLPAGPVLYGLCLVSGYYKSFSLKKITDIKLVDEDELDYLVAKGKTQLKS